MHSSPLPNFAVRARGTVRTALFSVAITAAAARGAAAQPDAPASPAPVQANTPVIVVELFTSEGCSSCPPAEDFASELAREHARGAEDKGPNDKKEDGKPRPRVLVMAHHVDYWDRLGWPDRFASPKATSRQREYAASLAKVGADAHGGVYTPQIVVNGVQGMVGSDRARVRRAMELESFMPPKVLVKLAASPGKDQARVTATATLTSASKDQPLPKDLSVMFAILESGLTTHVKRGENSGVTLRHDRVVREFSVVSPDQGGVATAEISIPPDLDRAKSELVAVVQRSAPETPRKVIGAAEVPMPGARR